MSKRHLPPSGHRALALVELIVAIGALAAVSVVVLQLFVAAARWENKARDLDMACFEAQSVVELYKRVGAPYDPDGVWMRPAYRTVDGRWEIDYASDWRPTVGPAAKGFTLSLSTAPAPDGLYRLDVMVVSYDRSAGADAEETVFELSDTIIS